MKPITTAWRNNAAKSFKFALGVDILKHEQPWQDYEVRSWGMYVDVGCDFGTAAIEVSKDILERGGIRVPK